ncbi:MAG: hypothetical protein LUD03_05180 [Firmicutes bacterium]|nr:hypothetical protein [Bacillota bacterium]
MKEHFSRFYVKTVEIYRITMLSSFEGTYNKDKIKSVLCDIQPCGGGMSEGERGFLRTAEMKMYFAADDDIAVGDYAVFDDASYIITYIEKRGLGYCAYLERREIYGG